MNPQNIYMMMLFGIEFYRLLTMEFQRAQTTRLEKGIEKRVTFAPKDNPRPEYHRKIPTRNWREGNYKK